jgi:hydroxyacylglutathione hydrolase
MTDAEVLDFVTGAPVAGDLDVQWIHGSLPARAHSDPSIQVHAYDRHTFVLRQSKAVHYEAPFLYLFCGNDRALLLDTGATADPDRFPLRQTVDGILGAWLADHPRQQYGLVVGSDQSVRRAGSRRSCAQSRNGVWASPPTCTNATWVKPASV